MSQVGLFQQVLCVMSFTTAKPTKLLRVHFYTSLVNIFQV